jgi:hypothetical protein
MRSNPPRLLRQNEQSHSLGSQGALHEARLLLLSISSSSGAIAKTSHAVVHVQCCGLPCLFCPVKSSGYRLMVSILRVRASAPAHQFLGYFRLGVNEALHTHNSFHSCGLRRGPRELQIQLVARPRNQIPHTRLTIGKGSGALRRPFERTDSSIRNQTNASRNSPRPAGGSRGNTSRFPRAEGA